MAEAADRYERTLEEKTAELKACQKQHGLQSCLPCPELDTCALHEAYVDAVHASMHKGSTGGFEF